MHDWLVHGIVHWLSKDPFHLKAEGTFDPWSDPPDDASSVTIVDPASEVMPPSLVSLKPQQ
jgi:hypothetical protein